MLDPQRLQGLVEDRHDLGRSTRGPNGQSATNHLAERGEVGGNAVAALHPVVPSTKREDLVENQHNAEF
ncbi:unannotated protein [freshwater metagenome]|uniref:Unannotated protein n=1 Tax=freshwater metagenome TaxID=449393 RepID=A0A6J6XYT6_9ZZZZ